MIEPQTYFENYFVINEIAAGGMATICRAYDSKHCRFVALKSLFERYEKDPGFLKRLQREGDIYKSLKHPNIIEMLGARYQGEKPYLALEYIHGETLSGFIARNPEGCDYPVVFRIIADITGALLQAHAQSIIHRDLQPQNVLIDGSGVVKLFDFGIAYADDDLLRTVTGTIMGTILYSSPEQSEGKEVDERADLYSLGLVFYELLCGKKAVDGKNLGEVLEKKLREQILPPSTHRADIPPFIDKMVMKLLNKYPEKRHRSIGHLMETIMDFRCNLSSKDNELLFGNKAEHTLYAAKKHFAVGRIEESISGCEKFCSLYEKDPLSRVDYLYLLARIYNQKKDSERANHYYDLLLENRLARNDHLLGYALFLHRQKRLDDALDVLAVFTKKAPLGTSAIAVRTVIKEEIALKKQRETSGSAATGKTGQSKSVAEQILADMDEFPESDFDDDCEPGIAEPLNNSLASSIDPEPVLEGDQSKSENEGIDKNADNDDNVNGEDGKNEKKSWRGAVKSWLSKAISKKQN